MTAGEIRSALEGVADDAEVQVRDTTTGVQLSIQAFEEGALVVDLEEEADEGDAADDEP